MRLLIIVFCRKHMCMKVILFGTGRFYQIWKHSFDFCEVVALIDNDQNKQGQLLDGHRIESPECISKYEYDYIFVLVKEYDDICQQLKKGGVSETQILDIDHPGEIQLISPTESFMSKSVNEGKHILLLSHSLDQTGAPLVLLDMAMILHRRGCQVHVISLRDGMLRERYMRMDISVTIAEGLLYLDHQIDYFMEWADTIVLNTLLFYPFLKKREENQKETIWWLHEEEYYYRKLKIGLDQRDTLSGIRVFGVGERVIHSFRRHFPNAETHELLYGIREEHQEDKDHPNVVFAFVGEDDYRKGGDILRASIGQLQRLTAEQYEYWIVGQVGTEKEEEFGQIQNVKLFGSMGHEDVMKLYSQIDVVVCPSRNDPMPVVVTEGMMMEKVCVVSEDVGQASMLVDKKSGLICRTDDVEDLCNKMKWILENRDRMREIGKEAKQVYKKYFSMEQFEKNVIRIVGC